MTVRTDQREAGAQVPWIVFVGLAFATSVCLGLLGLRVVKTRHFTHAWLGWNLFLAWLPVISAVMAYHLTRSRRPTGWAAALPIAFFWLLFFPNAPYLLTDLVHLRPEGTVSFWYDILLLGTVVCVGVLLGVVSLRLMQILVGEVFGYLASWVFVFVAIGLSGIGVYLGRFLRWNSWDFLTDPLTVLLLFWNGLCDPLAHVRTVGFAGMFSLCFLAVYVSVVAVAHLQRERPLR